jgi:hypothetical protein
MKKVMLEIILEAQVFTANRETGINDSASELEISANLKYPSLSER